MVCIHYHFEEGKETGVPGENPRRPALRKGATCQTAQTGTRTHVLVAGRIHTGIGDRRVTTAPHAAPVDVDVVLQYQFVRGQQNIHF